MMTLSGSYWREGQSGKEHISQSLAIGSETPPTAQHAMFRAACATSSHRAADAGQRSTAGTCAADHRALAPGHREDSSTVEQIQVQESVRQTSIGMTSASRSCISTTAAPHGANVTPEDGIRIHRLDHGAFGSPSGGGDWHPSHSTPDRPTAQRRRVHVRAARPHAQGEAPRAGTPKKTKAAQDLKKRALWPGSGYRLCFGDESGFNLYPYLTRTWHRKGRQPRVPTPGKNRKQYVFGVIDYKSGKFFYHMQDTNNQWGCLAVVQKLVAWARSVRTPVVLVWDNSRTHKAKRLQAYLDQPEVRRWLKIFWLSTYSPDLNDIERLWRHLKRTGVANHLFKTFEDFKAHLLRLLARVNRDSDRITGVVFRTAKAA